MSWPQNRPVSLVVSSGQPVPNFVGQQKAVAEQWAQANSVSLNEVADAKSEPARGHDHPAVRPAGQFLHRP